MSTSSSRPSRNQPPATPPLISSLALALAAEMAREWQAGLRPPAESFLDAHPELFDYPEAVLELIYEEICQRRQVGETPASTEILKRFPRWKTQLEILFNCHRLLAVDGDPLTEADPGLTPRFPGVGERVGEFELLAELGSGSLGRVFLATQPTMAHRPVVLKLTPLLSREYLSLARLQHTSIVPLHGVQEDTPRNLRVLCMPYFGGTTLARILTLLEPVPVASRTGRHILEALDQSALDGKLVDLPVPRGPARQFLSQASFPQAICWIVACLADALQYAHERGLVHLDIKPSNVLLAGDGQPMLLDFHLAHAPMPAGSLPDWFGGTPWHMSPEQQAALTAVRAGQPLPRRVDTRSDIYSLGLLLYDALGGTRPSDQGPGNGTKVGPRLPLYRCQPNFSVGLSDVVERCLHLDPAQRYPDAASLATDLRCHLVHLPLRGVVNRSWRERWQKWQRRYPSRTAVLALIATILLAGVTIGVLLLGHVRRYLEDARLDLAAGRSHLTQGRYQEARDRFRHGQALLKPFPGWGELKDQLAEQHWLAERLQLTADLHQVVERLRFLHDPADLPPDRLRPLEERCRGLWDARQSVLGHIATGQDPSVRQQVEVDLLDLVSLWVDLRLQRSPPRDRAGVQAEAVKVLDEAEELLGAHPVLLAQRQELEEALGNGHRAEQTSRRLTASPARTGWEHYSLGRFRLRRGQLHEAAEHFDRAVALQPGAFWFHFYRGLCAHRRGQTLDAVSELNACVALAPDCAGCYYNRALAYPPEHEQQALADYDRALQKDGTLGAAWLNRGVLHYRARRYANARADLEKALSYQASPPAAHYNLALVAWAQGDRATALAHLRQTLQYDPGHHEALMLQEHLHHPEEPQTARPGTASQ